MNLRGPGVLLLVASTITVASVLAVTDGPWRLGRAASAVSSTPDAGGSVCVGGGGAVERGVDMILASPPLPAADVTDGTEGRGVLLAVDETIARTPVGPYSPGSLEMERVDLGPEGWVWAGWVDHPLIAWREWRNPGGPGEPRASIVSRCIPADASEWVLLGLRTDGGNEALLYIANPHTLDATFAVTLRTQTETFAPIALRNVSVPAGKRVSVRVNDHLPEESDIAAVVTVGAGRLAVEGLQRTTAGVGGVEGAASVPALTGSAVTWTFPWLPAGPDVDGAVWVLNPEPRTVVVEAIVHTSQGAGSAGSVESIEISAGGFVRIATVDLAPAGGRVFGLTLRSETTGVYVGAGARFLSEDPRRTGLVRLLASSASDREWFDAGRHVPGRETVLHVVNLAEGGADVRITLTSIAEVAAIAADASDGDDAGDVSAGDDVVPTRDAPITRTLDTGVIAPGAVSRIVLPLDGAAAWSVAVHGGEALVVSRTTTGGGLLEPVAIDALPSRAWRVPLVGTRGRLFEGWVARLGTSGDLQRTAPTARSADGLPGTLQPVG